MSRAHRSFWVLTAVTVLAAGLVADALAADAGPAADIALAAGALLLATSTALLIRVLRHLVTSAGRHHAVPPAAQTADGRGRKAGLRSKVPTTNTHRP